MSCSAKEDGLFQVDQNRSFFIGSVFNFSIKSKWLCMDTFHVFIYILMRDAKTKDSQYNMHHNFLSSFSGEKVRIVHG